MNGIWLKKDVKILNPQNLWNMGIRFIYADATKNSLLLDTANVCAYYGFKLGLYHRLRYPPEEGSADSQAQEFMIQEKAIMNLKEYKDVKFLKPVLHLEKGGPVLCETNAYRGMVLIFLQKYLSYHGESENWLLKMTDDMIAWMKPVPQIVESFGLFYHEPTNLLSYKPWTKYEYRSYSSRSMSGNMVEPIEEWGALIELIVPPTVPPVVPKLTPEQKLAEIRKILDM